MEIFNLCLLVVLLAATGTVVGEDIVNECRAVGGECGDADDCPSHALLPGCPRHQVCCLHNHSTNILKAGERTNCNSTTRKCRKIGGKCFDTSQDRECHFIKMNKCRFDCGCCVNCTKQRTPKRCKKLYGGSCNASCGTDYLEVGNCKAGCKCCGCERLDSCKKAGGFCVTEKCQCDGRLVSSWCRGEQCHCCVPDDPCRYQTVACKEKLGHCRPSCEVNETPVKGLCRTDTCVCCVRNCTYSRSCHLLGGQCQRRCSSLAKSFPRWCPNAECTCCTFKKPYSLITCQMMGGSCHKIDQGLCYGTAYGHCGSSSVACCMPVISSTIRSLP